MLHKGESEKEYLNESCLKRKKILDFEQGSSVKDPNYSVNKATVHFCTTRHSTLNGESISHLHIGQAFMNHSPNKP